MVALTACGGSSVDLSVSVAPTAPPPSEVRPGDDVEYKLTVVNNGPGQATGVSVRVDLPTAFRYKATPAIDSLGTTTRTQPSDPLVDSDAPQWGQWSLGAPGINADGTPAHATLLITFTVLAGGRPASYSLTPHVFSDQGEEVVGKELAVHLSPSSDLDLTISVDEATAKRGDTVHYHVTLLNKGSGVAKGVGILITLPGGIVFNKTEHLDGNFSRSDPIDPISGALIVYYGGWVLPAASDARPGSLNLIFSGKVLPTAVAGRYSVTAQLTSAEGAVFQLPDTAPITINAPSPSPSPSASAGARTGSASPTPAPAATPTPPLPTPSPTHKHG